MDKEQLKNNMLHIGERIAQNKIVDDVVFIGATKTRSIEVIEDAVEAGLVVAGENRVQELLSKYKYIERNNGYKWSVITTETYSAMTVSTLQLY